jgi:sterol desaturase/sphingolipid hydroxylase (fatty acid hydroxylase superfamily)
MTLEITFAALLAVALWEFLRPRREREFPPLRRRLGNLGIWLANIILAAVIFAQPDSLRLAWSLGIAGFVASFLFLDLMSYGVHRLQHAVPLLWRLHALHHSDPDVDWSTSVRHHPAEFMIATGLFWVAVVALGIPASIVAAHAIAVFTLAAATHGNVRWPAWLERLLRPAVITLDLHLIHHSIAVDEANANFGAIFSFWDRAFGTLTELPRERLDRLSFGVAELPRDEACRPLTMLATPWRLPR